MAKFSEDLFWAQWKLMMDVRRVCEEAERYMRTFCSEQSVTFLQLQLLVSLHRAGPQCVSSLAQKVCVAGTNGSVLCKRTEREGFIQRVRDQRDERKVLVSLSDKGEAVVAALMGLHARQPLPWDEVEAKKMASAVEQLLQMWETMNKGEAI